MDFNKYVELRKKIKERDFENKNKTFNKYLYLFSYVGNICSIFFAYFLVYPALYKAISTHLTSNINAGIYISIFSTILILSIFEFIKRILLHNLSFDIVKNRFKIKGSIVSWLIFSITIIGISFYFSLTGAINFATTSNKKNYVIETNNKQLIDSLTMMSLKEKNVYVIDNNTLRQSNNILREKLINTNENLIKTRKEYQSIIDKNLAEIANNDSKIQSLNNELNQKITDINKNTDINLNKNKNEDIGNILLFLLLSTFIELLIIVGIYFREFYNYTLCILNESKMEKLYLKKERYITLLNYIYKNGDAKIGEKIIAVAPLKELIKLKTQIPNSDKFVEEFITDMDNLNIFSKEGKRRFINISYDNALSKVNQINNSSTMLENL